MLIDTHQEHTQASVCQPRRAVALVKALTTHDGQADFYKVMARTSDDGGRGERTWRLDPPASVEQVDTLGERFRPWRTLAAMYLYSSIEP